MNFLKYSYILNIPYANSKQTHKISETQEKNTTYLNPIFSY